MWQQRCAPTQSMSPARSPAMNSRATNTSIAAKPGADATAVVTPIVLKTSVPCRRPSARSSISPATSRAVALPRNLFVRRRHGAGCPLRAARGRRHRRNDARWDDAPLGHRQRVGARRARCVLVAPRTRRQRRAMGGDWLVFLAATAAGSLVTLTHGGFRSKSRRSRAADEVSEYENGSADGISAASIAAFCSEAHKEDRS